MATATRRRKPPVIGRPGPDSSMYRFNCKWNEAMDGPGCGPDQTITSNYEQERTFMTGGSWVLINRCDGCGQKISGSTMQSSLVTKVTEEHGN